MKRKGLEALLGELGFLDDPECGDTASRFAEVLREYAPKGAPAKLDTFVAPSRDRVVFKDLPFHSLCAHHLLPFHGTADVAYLPGAWGRIAGLGGVARALKHLSRQPQLQERLGAQFADYLHAELGGPVAVRLRARQMCMEMRGAQSAGTIETLALRGDASEGLLG